MNFGQLIKDIQLTLHLEGQEINYQIKSYINESIKEFSLMYDWKFLRTSDTITLDGSGLYTLDNNILTNQFIREYRLFKIDGGVEGIYTKYEYHNYKQVTHKTKLYAIMGNKLYIEGDNTNIEFLYITVGDWLQYPMIQDSDQVPALIYYPYIIKSMSLIKMFRYIGDVDMMQLEIQNLNSKLTINKKSEKTGEHRGKNHTVVRI